MKRLEVKTPITKHQAPNKHQTFKHQNLLQSLVTEFMRPFFGGLCLVLRDSIPGFWRLMFGYWCFFCNRF
jgi:hypothetical protein